MPDTSQEFLTELDKKLWNAADRLRASLDAAVYKHAVLGLIFLKYVSDSFRMRQDEVTTLLTDPESDYYLDPEDYGGPDSEDYAEALRLELEERDYYLEKNVFWVPALARWKTIQDNAKLPPGTVIEVTNGKKEAYEIKSLGRFIDDALEAVERENPKLKGFIEKNRYARLEIPQENLGGLIDLIATIPFEHADLHAKDILGHVYEYFLGQFALAEGKKGGQYFTPKSIVSLIVEMLEPYQGRVYDPAMGSGGFFVQSEKFITEHGGKLGNLSVYGQESNPTTWRLAAMNMAIRGIDFNFGKEPANSFTNDQHPDLRADYVMANPPFNIKEWWDGKLEGDARWKYGTPPQGNANFAWVQHMLHHLAPNGSMALLLANGSMSSNTGGEGDIRRALLEADLVECMVALPGQLFTNTQIPACIWFLTKNKSGRDGSPSHPPLRDRSGEVLFIDARNLGYMKDRVLRDFTPEDIAKIAGTFQNWKRSGRDGSPQPSEPQTDLYADIPGFCKSATLAEIAKHDHVLTPGRYVGAADEEDDGEPFAEKMARLTKELGYQFNKSRRLEEVIEEKLHSIGHGA
ncbi:type I restriction-modification system subunit M [Roseibacillus ishigakijimensis]|uniref:site-specific DNA-methyltransferase (adenine-specific) n=1 Tax=Roseibacillus ishigakijimensis TaxID=454146 RepID=A0A934RPY0_9BACT|nr:type I restriction-modification system subunit M [Roseibacillus ishigakijimensis]MBK1834820.1 type I restriction-modification system subunit M [Roseibacillus ishigakijimensis]